jgi:3',5'-cyclic AMP phosphodiesterase CpdA
MTTTRLALCSDTHFWPEATQRFGQSGAQMQPWSGEIQQVLLAELAAARPDAIVHLGDFTCGGGSFNMPPALFGPTLASVSAAFQTLPAPFYGLPGNHDFVLGEDWSYAEGLLGLGAGTGRTIDTPHARLILINAQGHSAQQRNAALPNDPTSGWVNDVELARLDQALAGAGDRPVLVLCHQLLQPWAGEQPWADLYGIDNAAEVLSLLSRYNNVRAVFQAHAHCLNIQRLSLGAQYCWFVVIPAVIEYPMAWIQLDVGTDAAHLTMRRLPLAELAELSRNSNNTDWRAGQPAWRNMTLSFK